MAGFGKQAAPSGGQLRLLHEHDADQEVREAAGKALRALGRAGVTVGDDRLAAACHLALSSSEARWRAVACRSLGATSAELVKTSIPKIISVSANDTDLEVRAAAAEGLEALRAAGASIEETALMSAHHAALQHAKSRVRALACTALGRMGAVAAPSRPQLVVAAGQDVCESVRAAATAALGALKAAGVAVDNAELLESYRTALSSSARAVRAGACLRLLAAGNDAQSSLSHLCGMRLDDPDPEVRASATMAWMVIDSSSRIPFESARLETLLHALAMGGDWRVRRLACQGLRDLGASAAVYLPRLIHKQTADVDPDVRAAAAEAVDSIRKSAPEAEVGELIVSSYRRALGNPLGNVRSQACRCLARLDLAAEDRADLAPLLLDVLRSEKDFDSRRGAAEALASFRRAGTEVASVELFRAHLAGLWCKEDQIRHDSCRALGEFGADAADAVPRLVQLQTRDPDEDVRSMAGQVLLRLRSSGVSNEAIALEYVKALSSSRKYARLEALMGLRRLGAPHSRPAREQLLRVLEKDSYPRARRAAHKVLVQLRTGGVDVPVESIVDGYVQMLSHKDRYSRRSACVNLGRLGAPAVGCLKTLQKFRDGEKVSRIRRAAIRAISALELIAGVLPEADDAGDEESASTEVKDADETSDQESDAPVGPERSDVPESCSGD